MLALDSARWAQLQHAYGSASDIPDLLRQLDTLPDADGKKDPWESLWSSMAHQGDVYSASFTAVPHVVSALSKAPERAGFTYFQFPAWVEICRYKKGVEIPKDLEPSYKEALSGLPALIAAASSRSWDEWFLVSVMSALAAAKGYPSVAEAVQELTPDVAVEFMEWVSNQ